MKPFKLLSLALITLLCACSTTKPNIPTTVHEQSDLSEKIESPLNLTSWEISGAIAAKNYKNAWTATLNWQQQGAHQYQIRLFGPLGGGSVMIEKRGSIITYRDNKRIATSKDANELLQQQTGIRLPVQNLYYWIRGVPAPSNLGTVQKNDTGQMSILNQDGYKITYHAYVSVNNMTLPSKISLEGHGLFAKVIIKHWRVG